MSMMDQLECFNNFLHMKFIVHLKFLKFLLIQKL